MAEGILRGIERGHYHIASPDFGQNLLVTSSASLTPRIYPIVLECLIAPVVVLALRIFGVLIDNIVMREAARQAKPVP